MLKWKSETGVNGTIYWVNLPNDIEISIMKRNHLNSNTYHYSLKWGYSNDNANCYWNENFVAQNWEQAKEKAIGKTTQIITRYLNELKDVLEVLNGRD